MAAQQKRMLTAERGKLSKADLTVSGSLAHTPASRSDVFKVILRKEDAWSALPQETQQHLYSLLPKPLQGDEPHDAAVNPLKTRYRPHLEEALRRWQDDLKDGKETKKWRGEAMQAGSDRKEGKFNDWKDVQREEYWGETAVKDENDKPKNDKGRTDDEDADAESAKVTTEPEQ